MLALLLLALPVKTAAVTDLSANYLDASFAVVSDDNISLAASSTPVGHIDSLGTAGVVGWVWMSSSPNTSLDVHIYVTNSSGFQKIYVARANIYRQDLYNAGYGNGYHGFSCDIDWRIFLPGTYNVEVYAIGGGNPLINNPPDTYTVRSCSGTVDGVSSYAISGWAWKPDEPNLPVDVHLYIRRSSGAQVGFFAQTADNYRADLYNAGYGNGNHGYGFDMDWSRYPEERLSLYLYTVDGSGANACFWTGYYDNRKAINLLGMVDEEGVKFYSAFLSPMKTWCENIGCTEVNRYTGANVNGTISTVKNASYSVIFTHGSKESLYCCLNGTKDDVEISDINGLSNDYFDSTRCLLIMACQAGKDGVGANNIVNAFYNKGVDTVVGFEQSLDFYYYNSPSSDEYLDLVLDQGAVLWLRTFTEALGNGSTISAASNAALADVEIKHGSNNLQGLDSIYIAGNANQIVKH